MFTLSFKRAAALVGAVAIFAVGGVAVSTSSASGPKTYTVAWSSVGSTDTLVTPVQLIEGRRSSSAAITITNTSRNQITFSAVNVALPTGLPVSSTPDLRLFPRFNTAAGVTLAQNGTVLELRNVDVPRNRSVTVSIDIDVPCADTSYVFTTDVRQSNDFNGADNKFTATNGTPSAGAVTMTTTGACTLAFNPGPASTSVNTTITSVANTPDGAPIKVEARDGGGTVMTWWDKPITLEAQAARTSPAGTGTVSPTTSTVTAGVATFSPTIDTAGTGYRLVANSQDAVSATSGAFDIRGSSATITCVAGDTKDCETGTITAPNGTTANVKVNENNLLNATLIASFEVGSFNCSARGYTATAEQLNFDVITTQDLTGITKSITVSRTLPSGTSRVSSDYQACFAAPYFFPAVDLNPGQLQADFTNFDFANNTDVVQNVLDDRDTPTVEPVLPANVGILLPCAYNAAPVVTGGFSPCVQSRTITGDVLTMVLTVPAADPAFRAG